MKGFKNIMVAAFVLLSVNVKAQKADSSKYNSAKDYIKAKEETDSNALRTHRLEIKASKERVLKPDVISKKKRFTKTQRK